MFQLSKQFRFEAAHRLPYHDGKCARLHGHSWIGYAVIEGEELQTDGAKAGMLIDYADLSQPIKELVSSRLDHYFLNESLQMENPTSEEIARWIFDALSPQLAGALKAIVIEETCTSRCEYRP